MNTICVVLNSNKLVFFNAEVRRKHRTSPAVPTRRTRVTETEWTSAAAAVRYRWLHRSADFCVELIPIVKDMVLRLSIYVQFLFG